MSLPAEQFFAAKMRGKFMLGAYTTPKLFDIGAWAEATYEADVEKDVIPNLTTGDGGDYETDSNVNAVTITCNLYNFNSDMFARLLSGTKETITAAAISNEVVTVYATTANYLVRLNRLMNTSPAPVVTSSDGLTTYAPTTDYIVHPGGLEIVSGGAIDVAADADPTDKISIKVSYTNLASDEIEAYTDFSQYFTARFILENKVRGANPEFADVWKFKFAPGSFPILDQQFKVQTVTLNLEADTTKGTGNSAYLRINRKTYT